MLSHVSHVWLLATLCTVCSLPGSSVRGILQARILEWVAMPSSKGSSWPRDPTCISYISCIGRQVLHTSVKTILYFWYYIFGKKHNIESQQWFFGQRGFTIFLRFFFWCGQFFKVFIEFATTLLLFYALVVWPRGVWDLSFPTKNQTCTPCTGRGSLNHGPPGKSSKQIDF